MTNSAAEPFVVRWLDQAARATAGQPEHRVCVMWLAEIANPEGVVHRLCRKRCGHAYRLSPDVVRRRMSHLITRGWLEPRSDETYQLTIPERWAS